MFGPEPLEHRNFLTIFLFRGSVRALASHAGGPPADRVGGLGGGDGAPRRWPGFAIAPGRIGDARRLGREGRTAARPHGCTRSPEAHRESGRPAHYEAGSGLRALIRRPPDCAARTGDGVRRGAATSRVAGAEKTP